MESGNAEAPYPSSRLVTDIEWSDREIINGSHGDNWPMTWIESDIQILAWGDGTGFDGEDSLSLGFAELRGDPPDVQASEFRSDADTPTGFGREGRKTSGLLMVDDTLYMFVRNSRLTDDHRSARVAWSTDRGRTFSWADWCFTKTFGCPTFVQFGPSYADARDDYVYIASQDNNDAYRFSPNIVLARAPKHSVPHRDEYEFFAGTDNGEPMWSSDIDDRVSIFHDPKGTHRISITYNSGIERYVLTSSHEVEGQIDSHGPGYGLFIAPEPWGPWHTVYYDDDFVGGKGEGEGAYHHRFPTKWMSKDGESMWMVYSRLASEHYKFLLREATLTTT